jgi:hypothetical protein
MKTFTITEAKKVLGALLKRAGAGEEIGIVCGAEIIALRKVEVTARDFHQTGTAVLREEGVGYNRRDPLLDFTAFEGSGLGDASINHDKYIYDDPV